MADQTQLIFCENQNTPPACAQRDDANFRRKFGGDRTDG